MGFFLMAESKLRSMWKKASCFKIINSELSLIMGACPPPHAPLWSPPHCGTCLGTQDLMGGQGWGNTILLWVSPTSEDIPVLLAHGPLRASQRPGTEIQGPCGDVQHAVTLDLRDQRQQQGRERECRLPSEPVLAARCEMEPRGPQPGGWCSHGRQIYTPGLG